MFGATVVVGPRITDEMIDSILRVRAKTGETRPKGDHWITRAELQEELNLGQKAAGDLLRTLLRSGEWEFFKGAAMSPTGICRPQVWYRKKPNA